MRRLLTVVAAVLFPGTAHAESPRDALFPSESGCFSRHYDAAHLASHPDQLVKDIAVTPEPGSSTPHHLVLRVTLQLRGGDAPLLGYGYCENTGGALSCGLEGDGGWFMLEPTAKGARMRVGRDGISFEGDAGFVTLGGGHSDDAVFALHAANSCR